MAAATATVAAMATVAIVVPVPMVPAPTARVPWVEATVDPVPTATAATTAAMTSNLSC